MGFNSGFKGLNTNSQKAHPEVSTLKTTLSQYYPLPILISYFLRCFSTYGFPPHLLHVSYGCFPTSSHELLCRHLLFSYSGHMPDTLQPPTLHCTNNSMWSVVVT